MRLEDAFTAAAACQRRASKAVAEAEAAQKEAEDHLAALKATTDTAREQLEAANAGLEAEVVALAATLAAGTATTLPPPQGPTVDQLDLSNLLGGQFELRLGSDFDTSDLEGVEKEDLDALEAMRSRFQSQLQDAANKTFEEVRQKISQAKAEREQIFARLQERKKRGRTGSPAPTKAAGAAAPQAPPKAAAPAAGPAAGQPTPPSIVQASLASKRSAEAAVDAAAVARAKAAPSGAAAAATTTQAAA